MIKRLSNIIRSFFSNGNSRTLAVRKNIIFSLGLKAISVLVTFLLVPLTIGYVSSELYGVWLSLAAVLGWLQILDIGLTPGLKNKLTEALAHSDFDRAKMLISTTYFGMFMIFVPLGVLGYFLVPYISWCELLNVSVQYEGEIIKTMQILDVLICTQMFTNVLVSVLAAHQRVAFSQSFLVIGNFIALVSIFVCTKCVSPSLTILAVIIAGAPILVTLIASIILYLTKYRAIAPTFSAIRPEYLKDILSLGVKFFIINVQAVIVYQSTNVLISHVSSPEEVTSYNIAYQYLSLAILLFSNITMSLWPAYTDAYAKGDIEWMQHTRRKMYKILALCIAVCAIFVMFSAPFYHIWIGNRANVSFFMTLCVALYICAYCYMNLNGTFIIGIGKVYVETITVIVGAIVYIPLALWLSHWFHQYGILFALIALNLIYGIIFHFQTDKLITRTATGIWDK